MTAPPSPPARTGTRIDAAERLSQLEEHELDERAAAWAAMSGRPVPVQSGGAAPGSDGVDKRTREATRREDDVRRHEQGRGPRL